MWGKVSLVLTTIIVFIIFQTEGKICPGFCVPPDLCVNEGGRVLGYCVDQRACCEVKDRWNQSTCGASVHWENKPAHFVSPKYPGHSSGSLICQYEMLLDKSTVGVKLDFEKFELDIQKLYYFQGGDGKSNGDEVQENFGLKCDSDLFFIKDSSSDWMTDPKCGNLNGYSMLLEIEKNEHPDRKIILLFIMSSKRYRWRIRIHQITAKKLRKSELCLETRMVEWEKNPTFQKKLNVLNVPAQSSKFDWSLMAQSTTSNTAQPWRWQANILLRLKEPRQNNADETQGVKNLHHFFCAEKLSSNYKIICTGSIVDDRHILIPASCLLNSQLNLHELKIEVHDPTSCKINSDSSAYANSLFDIESVTVHFNFLKSMRTNDIAMIRIRKTLNFNKNETYAQPLRLYDEYILPETLFFSSIKTEIQDFAIPVTPENSAHCSAIQTVDLQLTPQSVKELEESHKFRGLLDSWLCFNVTMKKSKSTRRQQDEKQKMGGNEKWKNPFLVGSLLMSSDGCGEKLRLIGIYNHVLSLEKLEDFNFLQLFDPNDSYEKYKSRYRYTFNHSTDNAPSLSYQKVFWPLVLYRPFLNNSSDGGINMNKSESEQQKSSSSYFFFTNLSLYRRWIFMAIS